MFSKVNIKDIPSEKTSHSNGSRKVLAGKSEISSNCFEAFTYGYLPAKEKWEFHQHENVVEICLVIRGEGVVRDVQKNEESFKEGDRFIFPAKKEHEIENTSDETAEFYFFRFKDQSNSLC